MGNPCPYLSVGNPCGTISHHQITIIAIANIIQICNSKPTVLHPDHGPSWTITGHPWDLISHFRRGVAFARESLQDPQISRGLLIHQGPPAMGPPWAQVVSGWRKSPWLPQFPGQFPGQHSASTVVKVMLQEVQVFTRTICHDWEILGGSCQKMIHETYSGDLQAYRIIMYNH